MLIAVLCLLLWRTIDLAHRISNPQKLRKLQAKKRTCRLGAATLNEGHIDAAYKIKTALKSIKKSRCGIKISEIQVFDRHGDIWKPINTAYGPIYVEVSIELPSRTPLDLFRKRKFNCNIKRRTGNKPRKQWTLLEFRWSGKKSEIRDPNSAASQVANFLMHTILAEFQNQSTLLSSPFSSRAYEDLDDAILTRDSWPSPQDFLEAVQNPGQNFKDAELCTAETELSVLGLPKVASGMFASVYELKSGSKYWAVRCFNDPPGDNHERYRAVSHFILSDDLPYTVDFAYIEEGISINSKWYPVVKMDWVKGETLDLYIEKHLKDKSALTALRLKFKIMMEKLAANGIAHGDLQHGNILVSGGEIYLVDYDAFYVPELQGKKSKELGHPNYQHPERSAEHFGDYLDNFSAHIIDLSLLCLIKEPELWDRFEGGDESILFKRMDFIDGSDSELFAHLLESESMEIKSAAARILDYLQMDPAQVPALSGISAEHSIRTRENAEEIELREFEAAE